MAAASSFPSLGRAHRDAVAAVHRTVIAPAIAAFLRIILGRRFS
jgi:hypothetical protein